MKLISWNVNGLRACLKKGFMDFFKQVDADIFSIQETKMQPEQMDTDVYLSGYHLYWNSAEKKGYSGTLTLTKKKPISVTNNIDNPKFSTEGRAIVLQFNTFYFVNVYSPNAQPELKRIVFREKWEDAFREHLKKLDKKKPVIICGDMNVARTEIDLKNPKANVGNPGFSEQEREKMEALLKTGFIDSFRTLYPNQTGAYTWWSYRANARVNNAGWRIDYFLLSERLKPLLKDSFIYPNVFGSDHCPVGVLLDEIKERR